MTLPLIALDTYRFTPDAIDSVQEFSHRGNKFKVCCASESGYHPSYWSHCDEVENRESLWGPFAVGDFVADVGADFGSYTLPALAAGAIVVAWSPPFKLENEPFEANVLRKSIAENGWEDAATVLTTGLWSRPGWFAAFDGPRMGQWFATEGKARDCIKGQPGHCAVFQVDTLDALGEECDWLKIDAEGAELDILHGGQWTIGRCHPRILLEHHYHLDPACEQKCDAFLAGLGYTKVARYPHHSVAHSLYEVR
jgi:FkbM family methyltransferase